MLQQQARFDTFVAQYNRDRPHQALHMQVPADVYARSARVYRGLEELTYPFHDGTFTVTQCGRIWLVTFMRYDLGYLDNETCRLEPIDNPFGPKVLPMSSE